MLKISDAVAEILFSSDLALEALRSGILNLSAYAAQILPQVEATTYKTVQVPSIVVALSRIAKTLDQSASLKPKVQLDEISIKSPLCDLTFEKTTQTLHQARTLAHHLDIQNQHFLTMTQGVNEITIIATQEYRAEILEHFKTPPKQMFSELVGVSMRFSETYLSEPNVIYTLLSFLAVKRINLIEIISTYTELTVVIEQKQMQLALLALNQFLTPQMSG